MYWRNSVLPPFQLHILISHIIYHQWHC